jgi:diacylglycerol kinase (ATP)
LGWGEGFNQPKTLKQLLLQLEVSQVVQLDRWTITFDGKAHGYLPIMNNYFSIGIDAKIAHKFHEKREANPENFTSQTMNKVKYGAYGALESAKGLHTRIEVKIDGKEIKLPAIQGFFKFI